MPEDFPMLIAADDPNPWIEDEAPAVPAAQPAPVAPAINVVPDVEDAAEKARKDALNAWKQTNNKQIETDTLNFDKFLPNESVGVRQGALIRSFMDVNFDRRPETTDGYAVLRDQIADQMFDGKGVGSDSAFMGEFTRATTTRRDQNKFSGELNTQAMLARLSRGDASYDEFIKGAHPGKEDQSGHVYLRQWNQAQAALDEKHGDILNQVGTMWEMVKNDAVGANVEDLYDSMDEEQRGRASMLLSEIIKGLPADKRESVMENLGETFGRASADAGRGIISGAGKFIEAALLAVVTDGAFNPSDRAGVLTAGDKVRGFEAEIRQAMNSEYDPIVPFAEDGWLQSVETGFYAAPGAIQTTAMMAIPGIGQAAMLGMMENQAFETYYLRGRAAGMSEAEAANAAGAVAPIAAIPQMLIEKMSLKLLSGKMPAFDGAITKISDKITNRFARYGTRTLTAATMETGQENVQDLITEIGQDLAGALHQDMPGADWDEVFDGYGLKTLSTFTAVLPLSIFGAAGGISQDKRNDAFKRASPLERMAAGVTQEDSDLIDAATGPASLSRAVTGATTRMDGSSELARESTDARAAQIKSERKIVEESIQSGALPGVRSLPDVDGFEVYDVETGATITTSATPRDAAMAQMEYAGMNAEKSTARLDFYTSILEASLEIQETEGDGRESTFEMEAGAAVRVEAEAMKSADAAAGIMSALESEERLNGGDGSAARYVMGRNSNEFEGKNRKSLISLQAGGTVSTLVHEDAHGWFEESLRDGRLTLDSTATFFRGINESLKGKTIKVGKQDQAINFDLGPAGVAPTQRQLAEAVAEFSEVMLFGTRNGKKAGTYGLRDILNKNLSARVGMDGNSVQRNFKAFIRAMKEYFGITLARHLHIKRGIADGTIDAASIDEFRAKLQGTTDQEQYESEVDEIAREIYTPPTAEEEAGGMAFSVGASTITPNSETRTFPTKDGGVVGPASFSIGAFHGTPHKVDKFTTDKMGTGEGVQAYGWGLYFAESDEVADSYRRGLSANASTIDGRKVPSDWGEIEGLDIFSGAVLRSVNGDKQAAIEKLQEKLTRARRRVDLGGVDGSIPTLDDGIKLLEAFDESRLKVAVGNLYAVELNIDADGLLDWDKPLSEQSESVQSALSGMRGNDMTSGQISDATFTSARDGGEFYHNASFDSSPQELSQKFRKAGIKGIKFLDGNSRNDGEGTSNYVIFDDADIKITEENGETVDTSGASFSIGNSKLVDTLQQDIMAMAKTPEEKLKIGRKMLDRLEATRRDVDEEVMAFGKPGTRKAISDPRRVSSLKKEASMRFALRRDELEEEIWAEYGALFSDEDITKLKSQPIHEYLADPKSPLKGDLMTAAKMKRNEGMIGNQYDGADGISRTVFGGTVAPDVAADELFRAGLLTSPTPDALWDALRAEQEGVTRGRAELQKGKQKLRDAAKQAREESGEWIDDALAGQKKDHNPLARARRAMATMDAILMALPPNLRGKVGGLREIANLNSDEKRLEFLRKRLEKVEKVVERHLKKRYRKMMKALLLRAKPAKGKPGEGMRGKAGATVHRLFDELGKAMNDSAEDVEAEMMKISAILESSEPLSAEDETHFRLKSGLLPLFGNWFKADAERMESAVSNGLTVFEVGYRDQQRKNLEQRVRRESERKALGRQTGTKGTASERDKKTVIDNSLKAMPVNAMLALISFDQLLQWTFGRKSKIAQKYADAERTAANAKQDALDEEFDALSEMFTSVAGGDEVAGERLRWDLSRKTINTTEGERLLSEFEGLTATLMWKQEDGQRHMKGVFDEAGKQITSWSYTQDFIDEIEGQLSDEAKEVRSYLQLRYSGEYDQINPIHVELYGISLPRNKNYSPLSVAPTQVKGADVIDPVSGMESAGISITPGSLRTRSRTAVAEPIFVDAVQAFIGHKKQIEHWKAYAPVVTELRAVMNNRELGNHVEAATGKEGLSTLRGYIDFLAMGGVREMSAQLSLNKALARATGRAASVALVGRFSVLAIQATQLGAAYAKVPTTAYLRRFGKLMTGRLGWGAAINSAYIKRRVKQAPPIVRQALDALAASKPSRTKYLVSKMGETISGADALFTAGTYAIIYDYQLSLAVKDGLAPAEASARARNEAERLTDDVAQPVRVGARSLLENTSQNIGMRLMWAFSSEPRQKLALSAFALAKGTPAEKARALAVTWGAGGAFASLIRAVVGDIRSDDDDEIFDDRHWNWEKLALRSLTGPIQGIPILGSEAEKAVFNLAGIYQPDGNLLDGAGKGLGSAKRVVTGGSFEDPDTLIRDIDSIVSGAGLFNDSIAAWASVAHIAKDLYSVVDNFIGDN